MKNQNKAKQADHHNPIKTEILLVLYKESHYSIHTYIHTYIMQNSSDYQHESIIYLTWRGRLAPRRDHRGSSGQTKRSDRLSFPHQEVARTVGPCWGFFHPSPEISKKV